MERIRLTLAAAVTLAASLASASGLPDASSIKTKFFGDSASTADMPAAPPAQAAPAGSAPDFQATANGRAEPDWSFTPGRLCTASDPDFKEYRYAERIPYCNRNVTQQMKQEVAAHYGIPQSQWSNYEFDHLIPLAIGGNSHVDNLWPQPKGCGGACSEGKDKLENDLYLQMKAGTITQAEAVKQIYAWFQSNQPALTGGKFPLPKGGQVAKRPSRAGRGGTQTGR